MLKNGPAPIPDLNSQYGTDLASGGGSGSGGLPDRWWNDQSGNTSA